MADHRTDAGKLRHLFIYLLYNRTQGTTKLKGKCTITLMRLQRDLTYSKLTRNQDRPTQ